LRILFVAMSGSIHTARWIGQLRGLGWDLHLFPVDETFLHPELRDVAVHEFLYQPRPGTDPSVRLVGAWPLPRGAHFAKRAVRRWSPARADRAQRLARVIRRLKPDLVHTMEIQHAAYLALAAKDHVSAGDFPPWLVSNWGSDIYLFGRLPDHAATIKQVMAACDYYHCECQRDVVLGRDFGFRGEVMPVFPVTGGFDVKKMRALRSPGPTSARRSIALKGYQNWAGRAIVGLRAIEMCADALKGYTVSVYMAEPDVKLAAQLVSQSTGISFEIESQERTRDDILRMHGRARISLGLSISDAISTSLLEAMIMGAFPVQSNTGCGDEWINCGENGLLVPPESPEAVAAALGRALADDALVDQAAETNAQLAAERLDVSVVNPQTVSMYETIAARGRAVKSAPEIIANEGLAVSERDG
jgi:glycosyltransferase involved in cell wall biosynthesis